jgi:hypothetical protein
VTEPDCQWCHGAAACSFGWWLVLICSERKILLADPGGWFVLREKYCWLVADKPNEQGASGQWAPSFPGKLNS